MYLTNKEYWPLLHRIKISFSSPNFIAYLTTPSSKFVTFIAWATLKFSCLAIAARTNKVLSEKIGFFNGKREGNAFKYFNDGAIKYQATYINNKLHGVKLNYFKNGNLFSESNYVNGKRDGLQKIWYVSGQLAKKKNLSEGKEEGMQQAWLENGTLYVNYEAKNGRIFGMNRANLCYKLKNEKVQYESK